MAIRIFCFSFVNYRNFFCVSAVPDFVKHKYEKTSEQKGLMLILNFSKAREGNSFLNSFDWLFSTVAKLLIGEFLYSDKVSVTMFFEVCK